MKKMRISLLAILVVYSHVMVGQNIDYNISPIKCVFNNLYLRDIPIHITIDYSTDGQRHLFLYQNSSIINDDKKEWYVYDIDNNTLFKLDDDECSYIGFSSDSLYGYTNNTKKLFFCKYPSTEKIFIDSGITARTAAMYFVAEHGITNGSADYSISSKGNLAYYNSQRDVLTLILFSHNSHTPIEIPKTQGCSHIQWIDSANLFFSELEVLDEFGTLTYHPKCYNLLDGETNLIETISDEFTDIYDCFQGKIVLRDGDTIKMLDLKKKQINKYPLPKEFPWIYCIYYLGRSDFLVSTECHEKGYFPFFILSYE